MATSIIPNKNESLLQTQQYPDSETETFATATSLNNREPRKVLKGGQNVFWDSTSARQSQILFPGSTQSWQPCYTHLLLYLLLWLGTYCFELNFWTIVQLNIPSFEKSILGTSRYKIPILTCYLLPFSFGHALSLFYLIFNYFHDFLDFQQAWIKFMIPNNGIHGTNSCKIN